MIGTFVCLMFAQAQRKRKDVYKNQRMEGVYKCKLSAYPHDLLPALSRDLGLLLDTHPGVHLRLNVVAQRRNKLSVTLLDSLHSVGEHLSHFENTNAARQHVADKRIAEAV